MDRYKLVVSDFHLGQGHRRGDGSINPLEDFIYDDRFAEFLAYHSRGPFARAEVELVIDGDFFNLIQVEYEEGYPDAVTEAMAVGAMRGILRGHPVVVGALQDFASHPRRSVSFVVGNHDQGLLWPGVRRLLLETVGGRTRLYPHTYVFDGVRVEHGHQNEALERFNPHRIAVAAHAGGPPIQNLPWGNYFIIDILGSLKRERPYVDKIRPFRRYLQWALVNDTSFALRLLGRMAAFYLKNRFHPDPIRRRKFSVGLRDLLEAYHHRSEEESVRRLLRKPQITTVVFGHTHRARYRQYPDGKVYLNTGVWNDFISMDVANPGRQTKLTYGFFEYRDGTPVATLKIWHGRYREEEEVLY